MNYPPYEPGPHSPFPSYGPPPTGDWHSVPSKARANWALGLACFPSGFTWIVAVVLAAQVIARSRDGRDHGKGMAVAALCIVGAWVLIVSVIVSAVLLVSGPPRDLDGRVTDGGRVVIPNLRVGDCLPAPEANAERLTVLIVPCSEPHNAEVYATFELEGEWTTLDEVDYASWAGCFDRFSGYVGVPMDRSSLEVMYYPPIEESFRRDKGVICMLVSSESRTSSLKSSMQ